ncbi:MAG: hypothetical protein AAB723_04055 [Patescibacteria group bacterium]
MQKFIEKFKNIDDKNGFYDFTPYTDGLGFSIKRDLNNRDTDNTSLLKFYIKKDEGDEFKIKKPIFVSVNYGKKVENNVLVRGVTKISSPADLSFINEYYYNASNDKIFKDEKEISACNFIDEIYAKHIKPTKPIIGFWVRSKMFFWKVTVNKIFGYIADFFHYVLYVITGDKYSYDPVIREEVLNNTILASAWKDSVGQKKDRGRDNLKESARFNFFGYEASRWVIVAYSILHLFLYIILINKNWKPVVITTIFKNNFLTIIYVISSLWILETLIPKILKIFIKSSSKFSIHSLYKTIKI